MQTRFFTLALIAMGLLYHQNSSCAPEEAAPWLVGTIAYPKDVNAPMGGTPPFYYNGTMIETTDNVFAIATLRSSPNIFFTDACNIRVHAQGNNISALRIASTAAYSCHQLRYGNGAWDMHEAKLSAARGFIDVPANTLVVPIDPAYARLTQSQGFIVIQLNNRDSTLKQQLLKAHMLVIDLKQVHARPVKKEVHIKDKRHTVCCATQPDYLCEDVCTKIN